LLLRSHNLPAATQSILCRISHDINASSNYNEEVYSGEQPVTTTFQVINKLDCVTKSCKLANIIGLNEY